jgi:hypothetical protein
VSFGLGFPFREPKKPAGHPLVGHMKEATVADVRDMLKRRAPTPEEADALAAEELTAWDREAVYALLSAYLPLPKPKPWIDPDPRNG